MLGIDAGKFSALLILTWLRK